MTKFKLGDVVVANIRTKVTGIAGNDLYFVRLCGTKITLRGEDLEAVK